MLVKVDFNYFRDNDDEFSDENFVNLAHIVRISKFRDNNDYNNECDDECDCDDEVQEESPRARIIYKIVLSKESAFPYDLYVPKQSYDNIKHAMGIYDRNKKEEVIIKSEYYKSVDPKFFKQDWYNAIPRFQRDIIKNIRDLISELWEKLSEPEFTPYQRNKLIHFLKKFKEEREFYAVRKKQMKKVEEDGTL